MTQRLNLLKLLCSFFLVVALGILVTPKEAAAISIKVNNPHSQQMSVAVVYFEDASNQWLVRGWYTVSPNSVRTLEFNSSTKMKNVWIHAHTSEASWGGGTQNSKNYTVIKEAFKYVAGQTCPTGTNRRQVGFDRWAVNNYGVVNFNP